MVAVALSTAERFRVAVGAVTAAQVQRADAAREAAVALVDRYASGAPAAVREEAAIRCGAYLLHQLPGADREREEGELRRRVYLPRGTSPLRSSGATAILAPWRRRRAR